MTAILTCRFVLSLRQFDSNISSITHSGISSQVRQYMASTVLEFGAQPSDDLPAAIASFAHPVHVDDVVFEMESFSIVEDESEWLAMDVVASAPDGSSRKSPTSEPGQLAELADSV